MKIERAEIMVTCGFNIQITDSQALALRCLLGCFILAPGKPFRVEALPNLSEDLLEFRRGLEAALIKAGVEIVSGPKSYTDP